MTKKPGEAGGVGEACANCQDFANKEGDILNVCGQKCFACGKPLVQKIAALKAENAALREALGESCPHGCSDGKCPWDRRVTAARRALKGEK